MIGMSQGILHTTIFLGDSVSLFMAFLVGWGCEMLSLDIDV
jgi:hypothetical protein